MPTRYIVVLATLLAANAHAALLPWKINFQGKLLDPATNEPRNGAFNMTLRIYTEPTGGTAGYTETQTVSVNNGVFSIQIGSAAALSSDLLAGASAYLGVTIAPDSEMSPRQQLVMTPYAVTATQLIADSSARVRVENAYSTFTATGDLSLSGGLVASSGVFSNGVDAASGTFSASGTAQYSVRTSSGVDVGGGTLRVSGSGGVDADYGVAAGSVTARAYIQAGAPVTAPAVSPSGATRVYYDSTADAWLVSANGRAYTPVGSASVTLWNTNATAGVGNQGLNLPAALTELDSAVQGTRMNVDCDDLPAQLRLRYNFRSLAGTALTVVMSVRDVTNTANVLTTVSQAVNAAQTWTGSGVLADKPVWCSGTQTVAVYTSGGNGAADFIFKHVILTGRP